MNNTIPVLIIGGKGFIGSAIARALNNNSFSYFTISRDECDLLNYIDTAKYLKRFEKKSVYVIFTAAIRGDRDNSPQSMEKNIKMIRNFIKASKNLNIISLVFLSSIDVYALEYNSPITEASDLFPNSFYATSKICSEYMLGSALSSSSYTILRLPGVYGKGDNQESIIGRFANAMIKDQEISFYNKGDQLRDYVFADDIGEIICYLIKEPTPGIFNVSTGKSLKILSIIELISKNLGKKADLHQVITHDTDSNVSISNNKLFEYMPGISITPMNLGIKKYIQDNFLDE